MIDFLQEQIKIAFLDYKKDKKFETDGATVQVKFVETKEDGGNFEPREDDGEVIFFFIYFELI